MKLDHDAYYVMEMALICAAPFSLIVAGTLLRRKFRPAAPAEGAQAPEPSAGHKAGRLFGTFLFWSGILVVLFCAVVLLNYLGFL